MFKFQVVTGSVG